MTVKRVILSTTSIEGGIKTSSSDSLKVQSRSGGNYLHLESIDIYRSSVRLENQENHQFSSPRRGRNVRGERDDAKGLPSRKKGGTLRTSTKKHVRKLSRKLGNVELE